MDTKFTLLLQYIFIFCIAVSLGFFLISRARRTFLFIKPELLRRNVVTYLIGLCFFFALGHLIPDFTRLIRDFGWGYGFLLCAALVVFNVTVPYNIVLYLTEGRRFRNINPLKQQLMIFFGIVISTMIINGAINYLINDSTKYLKYSAVWSFYIAGFGALIYLFIRHNEIERKRKLYEKEMEVLKLKELKTKAELDALHAKVNPHFLYNALNSIADLSITDGKKARSMTISLADLFRYSLNYSDSNYAKVEEEIKVAQLYLEIEKTRFEEMLQYNIEVDENSRSYLVPKFLMQPLIENAVKHGSKKIRQVTIVKIKVEMENDMLVLRVFDNGPLFPDEYIPGYGLKSVYEKLELLFPEQFRIDMKNHPEKSICITLTNPIKHEPANQRYHN